ncbi:MAG: shikimate dehydrogenase [Bacteroidota bacterium]|nr:shikimate dehydrogenase [Bacteroidota bacterium]
MRAFGLIGKQLGHSFSKKYFEEKFQKLGITDCSYELFPIDSIANIETILASNPNLIGLNVTIPYKESVLKYLDHLDPSAEKTGAVNCIKINSETGKKVLTGYNTDTFGFQQSIKPFLEPQHDKALILGTGGASKAVEYVLKQIGVNCFFVSRSNDESKENYFTYGQINEQKITDHFKLIINTTPVGMYPDVDSCPNISFDSIGPQHLLYDLVYNPEQTSFLKKGKEKGAVAINGLSMLYHQADKAWSIWNS